MAIRRGKLIASVPMSSMADIAFLLLIFFMVTSVLKVDADIPLDLPDAAGAELHEKDLNISISKDRVYYFNNIAMHPADLVARVRAEIASKPDARVLINAHNKLDFSLVADLLDRLKEAGVVNFAMVTKQEERKM